MNAKKQLLALRFKPSRFFFKGKMDNKSIGK